MKLQNLKELTVVYVEDDKDTREQTEKAIGSFFDKFLVFKNAKEALEIIEKIKTDVLITDIRMPQMNGIELVNKVRADNMDVASIIFVTAHDDSEYLMQAISLKVDDYILKPINLLDLLERILNNFRVKKQGAELEMNKKLINALSIFIGGKKIEIIRHLIEHSDSSGNYMGSYDELIRNVGVSKPTVVATFKQLIDSGLLMRVKNRHYKWLA